MLHEGLRLYEEGWGVGGGNTKATPGCGREWGSVWDEGGGRKGSMEQ